MTAPASTRRYQAFAIAAGHRLAVESINNEPVFLDRRNFFQRNFRKNEYLKNKVKIPCFYKDVMTPTKEKAWKVPILFSA
jgi:hypothetical protein